LKGLAAPLAFPAQSMVVGVVPVALATLILVAFPLVVPVGVQQVVLVLRKAQVQVKAQ